MKINVRASICTTELTPAFHNQTIPSETPENTSKQRSWETPSFEEGTVSPQNVGLVYVWFKPKLVFCTHTYKSSQKEMSHFWPGVSVRLNRSKIALLLDMETAVLLL